MAASDPLDMDNPAGAINRRISITVMTREAEERIRQSFNNPPPTASALPTGPAPATAPAAASANGRPSIVPNLASQVSQPVPVPAAPPTR
jgi:chemotaxis protein MotB